MAKKLTVTEMNCIKEIIMDSLEEEVQKKFSSLPPIPDHVRNAVKEYNELEEQIYALQEKSNKLRIEICEDYTAYGKKEKTCSEILAVCSGYRSANYIEVRDNIRTKNGIRGEIEKKVNKEIVLANLGSALDVQALIDKIKGEI